MTRENREHHIEIKAKFDQLDGYGRLVDFRMDLGGYPENLLGMMLQGYAELAMKWVEEHPKDCHGCIPFLMHTDILSKIKQANEESIKTFQVKKLLGDKEDNEPTS